MHGHGARAAFIIVSIVVVGLVILLMAFLVMWSWNGSLPQITNGARQMRYGNALALIFLLLFLSIIVFGWSQIFTRKFIH